MPKTVRQHSAALANCDAQSLTATTTMIITALSSALTLLASLASGVAGIARRLHLFGGCRLEAGRLQLGSRPRRFEIGGLLGGLFSLETRSFFLLRCALGRKLLLVGFPGFALGGELRRIGRGLRRQFIEGFLPGPGGRSRAILKRRVLE